MMGALLHLCACCRNHELFREHSTFGLHEQAESGDVVMVDVVPGADLTPGSIFLTQVRGDTP